MKTVKLPNRKVSPKEKAKQDALVKDLGSRFGNTETKPLSANIEPIILKPESQHQKRLHPEDLKVLSQSPANSTDQEEKSETLQEDRFGIGFDPHKLLISYKGEYFVPLTHLEIRLCNVIFTKESGYKFETIEMEDALYNSQPENANEKLKSVVKRFNKKIKDKTGIHNYLQYSVDYLNRKV